MVAPSQMDTTTTSAANDFEIRISRIADPNIGTISVLAYHAGFSTQFLCQSFELNM